MSTGQFAYLAMVAVGFVLYGVTLVAAYVLTNLPAKPKAEAQASVNPGKEEAARRPAKAA